MPNDKISILVVDDEVSVRDALCGWFEKDGYEADSAEDGLTALRKLTDRQFDICLLDIKMPHISGTELHKRIRDIDPDIVCIMITAYASVDTAVETLKNGAFDYVTKPIDPDDLSRIVRKAAEQRKLQRENARLRNKLDELTLEEDLIGRSPQVQQIRETIETVAQTDVSVLIRGESGTGKELIARLIHARSPRRYFPLVPVNCGALPESLLESELFGHEKGSFTGAQYKRRGRLEIANGGTLFLDEIGTIDVKTQIDLLRVLDNKQFTRLGGNEVVSVDFRLICATNQDLEQLTRDGLFREDFYYRINVFPIRVPPLRERPQDIEPFAKHFIEKYSRQINKRITGLSSGALDVIMKHAWPGNVRELKNAIERAVVVARGSEIKALDLPLRGDRKPKVADSEALRTVERSHILDILNRYEWNITKSAQALGIDRVTLYNKIKKYGLRQERSVR